MNLRLEAKQLADCSYILFNKNIGYWMKQSSEVLVCFNLMFKFNEFLNKNDLIIVFLI